MKQIKKITEDTDISQLQMEKYGWDLVVNGDPYQVVNIPGYDHDAGDIGEFDSQNSLWAYPLNKDPTYENLIPYCCKSPVCWGVTYAPINIHPMSGPQSIVEDSVCYVTRNGEPFGGRLYFLEEAQQLLNKIHSHFINFDLRGYEGSIIDREIIYEGSKGIIKHWFRSSGCIGVKFDDENVAESAEHVDEGCVILSIFDLKIVWYIPKKVED